MQYDFRIPMNKEKELRKKEKNTLLMFSKQHILSGMCIIKPYEGNSNLNL